MSVSRETLEELAGRYGVHGGAAGQLSRLLDALAAEPDPHTAVSDPQAALDAHVADSLSGMEIEEIRKVRALCDLGSGAGFPGLVLAVANPQARVDLLESASRKTAVITRLAQAADVTNARAVNARAEEWGARPAALGGGAEAYDVVTARAVASLPVLVEYAMPLLRVGGVLVAWKGARSEEEELAGARAAERLKAGVKGVKRVVPFEGAENRHLHVFRKEGPTPEGFPRRPGMAKKRPLS